MRESYLGAAANRNRGLVKAGRARKKAAEDDRLFPFTRSSTEKMWAVALGKAGLDSVDRGTGRKQLRIHSLRKFFRSQLALAVPPDIPEVLMGHADALKDAYRQYTQAQLAELYLKGEVQLVISAPRGLVEIGAEVKLELGQNRKLLETYVLENRGLNTRVERLESLLLKQGVYKDEYDLQEVEGYRPTGPLGEQPGEVVGWDEGEEKPRRRGNERPTPREDDKA